MFNVQHVFFSQCKGTTIILYRQIFLELFYRFFFFILKYIVIFATDKQRII